MNGLFGNCGGGLFGHNNGCNNYNNENSCNGIDCCTLIVLMLLINSCGCDIDWCTLILLFVILNCFGNTSHNCNCDR